MKEQQRKTDAIGTLHAVLPQRQMSQDRALVIALIGTLRDAIALNDELRVRAAGSVRALNLIDAKAEALKVALASAIAKSAS